MRVTRRSTLALVAASPLLAGLAWPGRARAAEDPRMTPRAIGKPDAKVQVIEFFSLTCTHCSHFSKTAFPQVKSELIDTGKILYTYRDFPLDQVALTAAMVARALPADRYEPFVQALFASQDRWAFARGVNSTDELAKMAALAGMGRGLFDATIADDGLKQAILAQQEAGEKEYHVDSTPTFIINGQPHPGALGFDEFNKLVAAATG